MKKTLGLIVLLLIVGLIMVIIGCQDQPESTGPQQVEISEEPEIIIEEEPEEIIVIEEPAEEGPVQIIDSPREEPPEEFLTGLKCSENRLEGTVTNLLEEEMDLSDAIVHINGILNRNIICDKYILSPGESTFCENFIGNIKLKQENTNKFNLRVSGLQALELVDC